MSNDTLRPDAQYVAPLTSSNVPALGNVLESYARMLGALRDIRAEVQNLRKSLDDVLWREQMDDTVVRTQEVLATVRENQAIYDYNAKQIGARLGQLRELIETFPLLYDRYGDEITHIENQWERAVHEWPQLTPVTEGSSEESASADKTAQADDILRRARRVIEHLDILIYHAGLLTIPGRLNQHLEQLRIGQRLDFHATFEDEVFKKEDRDKILKYLAARPTAISNGVIDAVNGLVFHASPSHARRRLSYVLIALTLVIGAALVYVISELGNWFDLDGWPVNPNSTTDLMVGYAFVIVGGFVHIGVDAIKQARSGSTTMLALEDWFLWIHINELGVIIGIVSLWIGFLGLLFLNGSVSWQTAFFVGYSIDSFVDMFLERFNTTVTTRTAAIKL